MNSFTEFISSHQINETVAVAKAYLLPKFKEEIDQVNLSPDEMVGAEDETTILRKRENAWLKQNRDYQKILQIVGSNQGYVGPFVKFRFEQGAPLEVPPSAEEGASSIRRLFDLIKESPQALSQLPMTVEEYSNADVVNGVSGFEALWDQLYALKTRKKHKWVIDSVNGELRRSIKQLSPDEIDRLYKAAKIIDDIDVRDGMFKVNIAPEGSPPKLIDTNHRQSILAKSNAIRDGRNWLQSIENTADGLYNADAETVITSIKGVSPDAGIIYNKRGYLVFSVRTEKAQKDICKIVDNIWCLNYGHWDYYGGKVDRIQINVFDFNKPISNVMHLIGMTIDPDSKELRNSHDMKDDPIIKSSNVRDHLIAWGYPDDLANATFSSISKEGLIKKLVLGLKIDSTSPLSLLESIINTSYTGGTEFDTDRTVLDPVLSIIDDRITEGVSKNDILASFEERGFLSTFSARLFNRLFKDMSSQERERIVRLASDIFDELREMFAFHAGKPKFAPIGDALNAEDKIMGILKSGETFGLDED